MISLSCCVHECTDVERVPGIEDGRSDDVSSLLQRFQKTTTGSFYPHTCIWKCDVLSRNDTGVSDSCGSSNEDSSTDVGRAGSDSDDDLFYGHFRHLPYEMKLHCLSFCTFHALANTELWLRHTDRFYYEKLMRDGHVMGTDCGECDLRMFALCKERRRLNVGLTTDHYRLSPTTQEKDFGAWIGDVVNRYPSFYYRRCEHFGHFRERYDSNTFTTEIPKRWARLHRCVGTRTPIDARVEIMLDEASRKTLKYHIHVTDVCFDESILELNRPAIVDIEPGLYYWELLDYNWETAAAAIEGDRNRQSHFRLHAGVRGPRTVARLDDTSVGYARERVCMSLLFRRVVHPSDDVEDRYTVLGYYLQRDGVKEKYRNYVYFSFGTPNSSHETPRCGGGERTGPAYKRVERQLLYQHLLAPSLGVSVHRCVNTDAEAGDNVTYYRADLPAKARLHSLERNRNAVRLNFFVNEEDLSFEEKVKIGASLVTAVNSTVDRGYAFTALASAGGMYDTRGASDVYEFFHGM